MQAANANAAEPNAKSEIRDFVTVFVDETMFGLAIERVHDVFIPSGVTTVPLASREIVGLLNLRGRVVTALCLRRRLGMQDRGAGAQSMAIGLEQGGETFALVVDGVGEVLKLGPATYEPVPINLDARWRELSLGVHRLDGRLLVILDVESLLAFGEKRPEVAA